MITRDEVAKLAGVSKSTVSRVMNNNGYVSAENRRKIEDAVHTLGYSPNLIARSLKTKETRQLLFYTQELSNPFYLEVYRGMEDYAEAQGYTIAVSGHYDRNAVKQRQYDGVITSNASTEMQQELLNMKLPAVITDYGGQPLMLPSIGIRIREGAEQAMQHLLENGHTRIAFLTNSLHEGDQRLEGYKNGLEAAGIEMDPRYILTCSDAADGYHQGHRAALELLDSKLPATAFFAFNDMMAIGALCALNDRGIHVPKDISCIGYDHILQSRYTCPPLTTVRIPAYEQGWESAKALLQLIKGVEAESLVLETELIPGKSVRRLSYG